MPEEDAYVAAPRPGSCQLQSCASQPVDPPPPQCTGTSEGKAAKGGSGKKWKTRLRKLLNTMFLLDPEELHALRVDPRELRAMHEFGIDQATYRGVLASAVQYSNADWQMLQDILMFHNSRGTRQTGSITVSGQKRDRYGWWHLSLDLMQRGTQATTARDSNSSSSSLCASDSSNAMSRPASSASSSASGGSSKPANSVDLAIWYSGFDQCSKEAEGAASCGCCALAVCHWLASHPGEVPTDVEVMGDLIKGGAAQWRCLVADTRLHARFPDGHFDLETVLGHQQGTPQLRLCPERSFVGFFRPPGVVCGVLEDLLQGSLHVQDIWKELESLAPATFIVAWNDHFLVLRLEGGPEGNVFLIDSLGTRLHTLCCCAFAVRFQRDSEAGQAQGAQQGAAGSGAACASRAQGGRACCTGPAPCTAAQPAAAWRAASTSSSEAAGLLPLPVEGGQGEESGMQRACLPEPAHAAPAAVGSGAAASLEAVSAGAAAQGPRSALHKCAQFVQHVYVGSALAHVADSLRPHCQPTGGGRAVCVPEGMTEQQAAALDLPAVLQKLQIEFHYVETV